MFKKIRDNLPWRKIGRKPMKKIVLGIILVYNHHHRHYIDHSYQHQYYHHYYYHSQSSSPICNNTIIIIIIIVLGICAMDKKSSSKPMKEMMSRLSPEIFDIGKKYDCDYFPTQ